MCGGKPPGGMGGMGGMALGGGIFLRPVVKARWAYVSPVGWPQLSSFSSVRRKNTESSNQPMKKFNSQARKMKASKTQKTRVQDYPPE